MQKALVLNSFLPGFFSKTKSSPLVKKNDVSSFRLWLGIGLIALNAVVLMSYIYGVNEYAGTGYKIQSLQTNVANLNADNRQINLKVAEAGSMVSIQSDFLSANFVPAGTPVFLQDSEFTMNK